MSHNSPFWRLAMLLLLLCFPRIVTAFEDQWVQYREDAKRAYERGEYQEAERLYRQGVTEAERAFGDGDLRVATSLGDLAEFYRSQGRYAEAESLLKKSLSLREKGVGKEDISLTEDLNHLAWVHYTYGNNDEAEQLFRQGSANSRESPRVRTSKSGYSNR
jgi:tetratricopeptide (TPR) repeat protein